MIAEDAVLIQENIRRVVQRECDVVAAVEDGEAVIQAIETHAPDILLLDVSFRDERIRGRRTAKTREVASKRNFSYCPSGSGVRKPSLRSERKDIS